MVISGLMEPAWKKPDEVKSIKPSSSRLKNREQIVIWN
jgi:hypothetical protein